MIEYIGFVYIILIMIYIIYMETKIYNKHKFVVDKFNNTMIEIKRIFKIK